MIMRRFIKTLVVILFLGLATFLQAQEKSDWYYIDHSDEILKDATSLFQAGNYARAIDLCNLHSDILGDEHDETPTRDELMSLVLKCQKLATDLENYIEDGYMQAAKAVAEELRALNPSDERLKQFGLYSPPSANKPVVQKQEDKKQQPPVTDKPAEEKKISVKQLVGDKSDDTDYDDYSDSSYGSSQMMNDYDDADEPKIAIRVGAGLMGLGQDQMSIAPSLTFGYYNMGYSIVGAELMAYFNSWLAESKASMVGADALVALRVAKGVFPKAGVGFFSCGSTQAKNAEKTMGMCIPAGVSFVFGNFSFDIMASGYPEVKIWQVTKATASQGVTYDYKYPQTVLGLSVVVGVSLGVAF